MTALLTPEQIATIDSNRETGCTCCSATYYLLRDREAIAERLEGFARRLGDDFDSVDEVNKVENELRALVTAIRGEK